jgi:hypothetical protein
MGADDLAAMVGEISSGEKVVYLAGLRDPLAWQTGAATTVSVDTGGAD